MIKSFLHKGLEKFYRTGSKAGIQAKHASKLRMVPGLLHMAAKTDDVNLPGYRLHSLTGKRKGFFPVWGNGNWRIIFRFVCDDIELVNYLDYH